MRLRSRCLAVFAPCFLFACQSSPVAPSSMPSTNNQVAVSAEGDKVQKDAAAKTDDKDARLQKQKDLRQKQRDLEQAKVDNEVAEIDRSMRSLSADDARSKANADLQQATRELESFQKDVKPRQLEEKRIGLDGATYRAEHQKDELGELMAMYQADEFARTTKELVLKRSRHELELAERSLAVTQKENAHFEQEDLPERERDLQRKVVEATMAQKKAEAELKKMALENAAAIKKAQQHVSDLEEEIAELQQKLQEKS